MLAVDLVLAVEAVASSGALAVLVVEAVAQLRSARLRRRRGPRARRRRVLRWSMVPSFKELVALVRSMPDVDPSVPGRDSIEPWLTSTALADGMQHQPTWNDVERGHKRCHRAVEWQAATNFRRCHALVHFFRGDGLTDDERTLLDYWGPDHYGHKSLWTLFP